MTGKQKATIAVIVIILLVLAFVLPNSDQMTKDAELRSIGYQREKVIVPILAGVIIAGAAGYCIFTKIDEKRIAEEEKRRKKEDEM